MALQNLTLDQTFDPRPDFVFLQDLTLAPPTYLPK
jgi:hypothetical protein